MGAYRQLCRASGVRHCRRSSADIFLGRIPLPRWREGTVDSRRDDFQGLIGNGRVYEAVG